MIVGSVSITNIQYYPSYYVRENGGCMTFEFDVAVDCSPGPEAESFEWTIRLVDGDGNTACTATGTGIGSTAHVKHVWASPSIPDGGARPYITVKSECTEETTLGFCTGISKVKSRRAVSGEATCSPT